MATNTCVWEPIPKHAHKTVKSDPSHSESPSNHNSKAVSNSAAAECNKGGVDTVASTTKLEGESIIGSLQSVGIPIFDDKTYDNGYLYVPPLQSPPPPTHIIIEKPKKNSNSHVHIPKTLASFRTKRTLTKISTQRLNGTIGSQSNSSQNSNNSAKTEKMDVDTNQSPEHAQNNTLHEPAPKKQKLIQTALWPFLIHTHKLKVSDLSKDLARKIKTLPQSNREPPSTTTTTTTTTNTNTNTNTSNHDLLSPLFLSGNYDSDASKSSRISSLCTGNASSSMSPSSSAYLHLHLASSSSRRLRGRAKSTRNRTKSSNKLNLSELDALSRWFFEHCKEAMDELLEHECATYFRCMEKGGICSTQEWHDVVKQSIDLDGIRRQLVSGAYVNAHAHLVPRFVHWKSDVKTVFENFAMVYGPELHRRRTNGGGRRRSVVLDAGASGPAKLSEIYRHSQAMLVFFNAQLLAMQKNFKKLFKTSNDWNVARHGKYSNYIAYKGAFSAIIYDRAGTDGGCETREIQSMLLVHMCPKRHLQLRSGKFLKKEMDVLPRRTLYRLSRSNKYMPETRRSHPNSVALSNQKKIFWHQHAHQNNSLQYAMRKIHKESAVHALVHGDSGSGSGRFKNSNRNLTNSTDTFDSFPDQDEFGGGIFA